MPLQILRSQLHPRKLEISLSLSLLDSHCVRLMLCCDIKCYFFPYSCFSFAVIKHHNQGYIQKKEFIWAIVQLSRAYTKSCCSLSFAPYSIYFSVVMFFLQISSFLSRMLQNFGASNKLLLPPQPNLYFYNFIDGFLRTPAISGPLCRDSSVTSCLVSQALWNSIGIIHMPYSCLYLTSKSSSMQWTLTG